MTREEAIYRLKTTDACDSELCEALDMAIKALEQEPCDDVISREAVIKTISEWFFSKEFHYTNAAEYLRNRLDELPSVTPQQKMGRWNKSMDDYSYFYTCSCCGQRIAKNGFGDNLFSPYCPECGAKMQEVRNDD